MLNQSLEEKILKTKSAFKAVESGNLIQLCEEYLSLLEQFRNDLYKFQGAAEISLQQTNPALHEEALGKRREIRLAVMQTIEELNRTTALLNWLTSSNGQKTVETFNHLNYKNHRDWEFRGGIVRFAGGSEADQIVIQKAVEIAVNLRCKEFISSDDFKSFNY